MKPDGTVDYRSYTLAELKEALSRIDRSKYPINLRNLEAEIASRPVPASSIPSPRRPLRLKAWFFGFCWYLIVWFGVGGIFAAIVGTIETRHAKTPAERYLLGKKAGAEFGRKYGPYFEIGGLVIAIIGTAAGVLPGTRYPKTESD